MVSSGILRFSLAKLFDIFAANQNHVSKYICRPRISRLARKKERFTEGSLSFGARIDNNIKDMSLLFSCSTKHQKSNQETLDQFFN